MNKKVLYLVGAIVGVAVVTLLMTQNKNTTEMAVSPEATPANGIVAEGTATETAIANEAAMQAAGVATPTAEAAPAVEMTAPATDATPVPTDGTPATEAAPADEVPAGAEVAPTAPDSMDAMAPAESIEEPMPATEGQ